MAITQRILIYINVLSTKKKKKYFSQNGEDGILEYIFCKIGFTNKFCVEYGAGDGKLISNTYLFKDKYNFNRILLEGDMTKIKKNNLDSETITHCFITSNNINDLIKKIPEDNFDLLSSDIDGDDYWVWKAMNKKPRVVIVEYNCGIPNDLSVAIIEGEGTVESDKATKGWNDRTSINHNPKKKILNGYFGANLKAFYRLAIKKGYEFVTTIQDNAIFVLKEEFPKLGIDVISEEECLEKYYNPSEYWAHTHRDMYNKNWVILDD